MKTLEKDIQVNSTIVGESIQMGIDAHSLVHIMDVLSNLYKDPETSVIRELSTNARDATIEAGSNRPIEVTTPNAFNNNLVIKDYGTGMSIDDIRNVYSQYGTSTRRDSNDFVGSLGLGSKSPFTLTSQFNVISVKNGKKIIVSVSRDQTGAGSMQIISHTDTTDENGTTISVPVPNSRNILSKAESFYQFWEKDTVILNEYPPKCGKDAWSSNDGTNYVSDMYNNYIVMGNVPYPVELPYENNIVHYAPMGAVDFTPSREALYMSTRTKDYIKTIEGQIQSIRENIVAQTISHLPTNMQAWKAYMDVVPRDIRNRVAYSYKGMTENDLLDISAKFAFLNYDNPSVHKNFRLGNVSVTDRRIVIINDYDNKHLSDVQVKKTAAFLESKGYADRTTWILFNEDPSDDFAFLDESERFTWEDIKKTKIAMNPSGKRPPLRVIENGKWADENPNKPLLIDHDGIAISGRYRAFVDTTDVQYKKVSRSYTHKFVKNHPQAVDSSVYIAGKLEETLKNASRANIDHLVKRNIGESKWHTDADAYLDPEIKKLAEKNKHTFPDADYAKVETAYVHLRNTHFAQYTTLLDQTPFVDMGTNWLVQHMNEHYPLTKYVYMSDETRPDIIDYVNMVYLQKEAAK